MIQNTWFIQLNGTIQLDMIQNPTLIIFNGKILLKNSSSELKQV